MSDSQGVIHIASFPILIGGRFQRQRCSWCGAVLVDNDFSLMAVAGPDDQWVEPATWPPMDLVLIDGNLSAVIAHEDGDELPSNCCARLDPGVTL